LLGEWSAKLCKNDDVMLLLNSFLRAVHRERGL